MRIGVLQCKELVNYCYTRLIQTCAMKHFHVSLVPLYAAIQS